jgi:hypothetical protein
MKPSPYTAQSFIRHRDSGRRELGSDDVRPYGRYGVGTFTAHPVGIVVVIAVIVVAMMKLPPARPFFVASVIFGGIFGLVLWLRNRNRGF